MGVLTGLFVLDRANMARGLTVFVELVCVSRGGTLWQRYRKCMNFRTGRRK